MKKMGLSMEPRVEVEVEEREAVAEVEMMTVQTVGSF